MITKVPREEEGCKHGTAKLTLSPSRHLPLEKVFYKIITFQYFFMYLSDFSLNSSYVKNTIFCNIFIEYYILLFSPYNNIYKNTSQKLLRLLRNINIKLTK